MRRLLLIALLLLPLGMKAQVIDTLIEMGVGTWLATPDTVRITDTVVRVDTVVQVRVDTVVQHITDTIIKRVADTAALSVLREKEAFYKEIPDSIALEIWKLIPNDFKAILKEMETRTPYRLPNVLHRQ